MAKWRWAAAVAAEGRRRLARASGPAAMPACYEVDYQAVPAPAAVLNCAEQTGQSPMFAWKAPAGPQEVIEECARPWTHAAPVHRPAGHPRGWEPQHSRQNGTTMGAACCLRTPCTAHSARRSRPANRPQERGGSGASCGQLPQPESRPPPSRCAVHRQPIAGSPPPNRPAAAAAAAADSPPAACPPLSLHACAPHCQPAAVPCSPARHGFHGPAGLLGAAAGVQPRP